MGIKELIDLFQGINKRDLKIFDESKHLQFKSTPDDLIKEASSKNGIDFDGDHPAQREINNKIILNPFIRNIVVDALCMNGSDTDGDMICIQGSHIVANLKVAYFAYSIGNSKLPDKVFVCKYRDKYCSSELIVFADSKEDIESQLRKHPININAASPMYMSISNIIKPYSTDNNDAIDKLIEAVDIESAVEITNPDDCRLYIAETDQERAWLM